ncbi:DUF3825 domain-containing protein [Phaeobacter porticola]|uniref:Uncharacterized protein n=1 Tax=Phaeobacter porticola TaxID=1844006 RepID=A0A1L3I1L3_9RHOB|nr:DUF3825 domain-containing protein [Phaeobacter porticola]APG45992.1 hypothetical protein PhaeoP97_00548 [Phaeobacter porticola]
MITREEMLGALGTSATAQVVERFRGLAFIAPELLQRLADQALTEEWGRSNFALEKYLAVHIPWAIEQGAFSTSEDQIFFSAGHLQTRYGTPLYLVFERNDGPFDQLLYCKYAGTNPSAPNFPSPPEIPAVPEINKGSEIVMLHDHILGDNADRVPFLRDTPPVAQMCAISGAIQWSLNSNLEISYYYFGTMSFLAPLYLQSRENITEAPDLIAPVQVNRDNLVVRTVLTPHMPYANARVAVERHDKLPAWMLSAWNAHSTELSDTQVENPEQAQ